MEKQLKVNVTVLGSEEYKKQVESIKQLLEKLDEEVKKLNEIELSIKVDRGI